MASDQNLIILTFDSDYGEFIFEYARDNPPAVVFFREKGNTPSFAGSALITLLQNNSIRLSEQGFVQWRYSMFRQAPN